VHRGAAEQNDVVRFQAIVERRTPSVADLRFIGDLDSSENPERGRLELVWSRYHGAGRVAERGIGIAAFAVN
jgi:hypothetical protein